MNDESSSKDWSEIIKEGITGFAEWSTPLGVARFCGPVKSMTIDDTGKIRIEFEWVATVASAHIGKEPWHKYPESDWIQEFDSRSMPFQEGIHPDKGYFIAFAQAHIYTEYEGGVKKSEVNGLN